MTMAPNRRDANRQWILRAARGEIDTPEAFASVIAMHWDTALQERDPELAAALNEGDQQHPNDPRRWDQHNQPPWAPTIDPDPATTAAFDQLVNNNGHDDYYDYQWAPLIIDGKTWLTSGPDHPEPLWGTNTTILAAKGQPTTIAGPQGAGKSVFGQRIVLGWIGLSDTLLGFPLAHGERNGLYLACDRPEQARLSTRRMVEDDQLDTLQERLRVWKGPPPEDVAKQPLMLLEMAQVADADLIVIDSAKDVALKLSADEIGAAYNSALQHCVAAGIEVIVLHHPRKLSGETRDNPVRVLDDLYGAYWVTAGNGSVIYLQPGDFDTYTLTQLKSPNGEKAEIPYEHVVANGDVRPPTAPDIESILEKAGFDGVSAVHIARILCKVDEPSASQAKKVRRALTELSEDGVVESVGTTKNKKWRLVESFGPDPSCPNPDQQVVRNSPNQGFGHPPDDSDKPQVSDSDKGDSDTSPPPLLRGGDEKERNPNPGTLGPRDPSEDF